MSHEWDANLVMSEESRYVSHQLGSKAFRTPLCNSLDEQREPRDAVAARLVPWQSDIAAKPITRACFRVDPGVSAGVHALAMADDEKRTATLSPP